jgi:aerobic-type carbon monoxide dehydrogenase small subunit (CoxS/CutS family)
MFETRQQGGGCIMVIGKNLPMSKKYVTLTVNGEKVEREIDSRVTLAEFLREELDLTGTKVGCNRAECGSCTVILDGIPVLSCTVLAVEVSGREVLTIEGISEKGKLHPLQKAFVEHDALQCGYCTPGMVMSVKALLDGNPHPTEEDVRRAIDGNLCRCGSYPNIIKATLAAAQSMAQKN